MVLRTTILVAAPLVVVAEIGDDERNARAAQEFAGASSQIQKNPPVAAGSDNSDYWKALGNENKVDAKELAKWFTSADTFTGDTTLKGAVDADDTLEGQKLVKNWPYLVNTDPNNPDNITARKLESTGPNGNYTIGPRFTTTMDVLAGIHAALNATTGTNAGNASGADWAVLGDSDNQAVEMQFNAVWLSQMMEVVGKLSTVQREYIDMQNQMISKKDQQRLKRREVFRAAEKYMESTTGGARIAAALAMFSKYLLYEMGTQWINYRKLSTPMNSFNSATQARIIKAWLSPGSEWIKWQDASYKELYHDLGVLRQYNVSAYGDVQDVLNFFPVLLEEDRAETTEQAMKKQVDKYISMSKRMINVDQRDYTEF